MSPLTIIIIGGGVLLVVLLIVGLVISSGSERQLMEQRLGQYIEEEQSSSGKSKSNESALGDWVTKRVAKTTFGDKIARDLARADIKFKVGEYIGMIAIAVIGLGTIAFLMGDYNPISFLIGAVIGGVIPGIIVKRQQAARLVKFNAQLPDMLSLSVNGLRAGYSTMQALESVSKEMPSPMSDEFKRVVQEIQIGVPMETALENLVRRIPSEDLDFVVTAINVQREVGGNLSEILETIAYTIRERIKIKGEVRVLTSQVRASGTILSLIPVGVGLFIWFSSPDYMDPIVEKGTVCIMIFAGVVLGLIGLGYFVMMKIADIKV